MKNILFCTTFAITALLSITSASAAETPETPFTFNGSYFRSGAPMSISHDGMQVKSSHHQGGIKIIWKTGESAAFSWDDIHLVTRINELDMSGYALLTSAGGDGIAIHYKAESADANGYKITGDIINGMGKYKHATGKISWQENGNYIEGTGTLSVKADSAPAAEPGHP